MNWFTHRTATRRHRRLLPGHAQTHHRPDLPAIPGVDPAERRARRREWGYEQTWRFDRTELTGRFALGLAVAVLTLVMLSVVATPAQPLERAQTAAPVPTTTDVASTLPSAKA